MMLASSPQRSCNIHVFLNAKPAEDMRRRLLTSLAAHLKSVGCCRFPQELRFARKRHTSRWVCASRGTALQMLPLDQTAGQAASRHTWQLPAPVHHFCSVSGLKRSLLTLKGKTSEEALQRTAEGTLFVKKTTSYARLACFPLNVLRRLSRFLRNTRSAIEAQAWHSQSDGAETDMEVRTGRICTR